MAYRPEQRHDFTAPALVPGRSACLAFAAISFNLDLILRNKLLPGNVSTFESRPIEQIEIAGQRFTEWTFADGDVSVIRSQGHCAGHVVIYLRGSLVAAAPIAWNGPGGLSKGTFGICPEGSGQPATSGSSAGSAS